ncbi:hypothetical protein V496_09406 [Pseudogymnoascus sp. VKM F-4515 (FW-2607)]|nr:hypothetical protein V496_09406 [Pseudogymnoascus sp. VKM F-4515 (FW-2607)]
MGWIPMGKALGRSQEVPKSAVFNMSLAKRNNGCLECRMRRVRCDKAEPECFKCRKKGIKCSGQGIECRFSSHMTRMTSTNSSQSAIGAAGMNNQASGSPSPSRVAKRYRSTNIASTQLQMRAPRSYESKPSTRCGSAISSSSLGLGLPLSSEALDDGPLTSGTPSHPQLASILDLEELDQDVEELDQSRMQLSSPRAPIQVVPAQARMLFDHFSKFIAAKMVVFDFTGNGYRQIVLPLACQDEMVGRAVSVIAAFHLAQEAPHMRIAAERGQQAILSRLCRDSLLLEPERLFSLSKWATVLVLLVGTTITGSDNFVYLLELLSCLARSSASVHSLSDTTRAFIMEQTRMFELFGFPLSSEEKGLKTLTRCPDYYLDFMLPCPSLRLDPAVYSNAMCATVYGKHVSYIETVRYRALHRICRTASPDGTRPGTERGGLPCASLDLLRSSRRKRSTRTP